MANILDDNAGHMLVDGTVTDVPLTDELPGPDLSISGASGQPVRLPRGQVWHPDGWFFVR